MNIDTTNLYTDKEYFIVVLDSRNSTKIYNPGYNSQVEIDLPEPIMLSRYAIKMSVSVLSFVCPNSIYIINETNNVLLMTINGQNQTYFIPYGNYDATTFLTYIQSILSSFTITFNTINNKFTLSNPTNFTINSGSTIYEVMGFNNKTTYTSTLTNGQYVLTLPYTCNFNGLQNINILLTSINTKNVDSYSKSNSNIIQSVQIPLYCNQILFQKTLENSFNFSQEMMDDIRIELRDDLNNLINLNNQHFNITLLFTTIKDIERFKNHINFHDIINYGLNY